MVKRGTVNRMGEKGQHITASHGACLQVAGDKKKGRCLEGGRGNQRGEKRGGEGERIRKEKKGRIAALVREKNEDGKDMKHGIVRAGSEQQRGPEGKTHREEIKKKEQDEEKIVAEKPATEKKKRKTTRAAWEKKPLGNLPVTQPGEVRKSNIPQTVSQWRFVKGKNWGGGKPGITKGLTETQRKGEKCEFLMSRQDPHIPKVQK